MTGYENVNNDRLSEAGAYFDSLINPNNLYSGDKTLLPKDLYDEWDNLLTIEEDYHTEQRYYHPDERKEYAERVKLARVNFKKSLDTLYQDYISSGIQTDSANEKLMTKSETPDSLTLMRQFDEMKKKHPDAVLLFRAKDEYLTYRQDAVKAKQILGLEIESIKIGGVKTEVASFKHDALDTYLPKLVRAGMRVAICEQLEDLKQKKKEKEDVGKSQKETPQSKSDETQLTNTTMPRKKKEKAPEQEQPKAKAEAKSEVKSETKAEVKTEAKAEQKQDFKSEQKQEAQQERKPREPQMVTVNGDKVTHGHAFQGKDSQDWYFTAKLNGEQLKPQKMDPADLAAYQKKEMTVPQLMERYYPTKLMPKVPEMAFKTPNVLPGPEGNMTIDKFNVYKEKDQERPDFGKYKFYAQIGENKMSTVASRQDLNAYFDRVMTPGQLVEKNFGERLHLSSHYQQFRLPEGVENEQIRIAKDRSDGKWKVSVDLGERGKTEKKELSFDDGYSLYKTKTATREQIAAKYVGNEVRTLLAAPAMKMEKSAAMKM